MAVAGEAQIHAERREVVVSAQQIQGARQPQAEVVAIQVADLEDRRWRGAEELDRGGGRFLQTARQLLEVVTRNGSDVGRTGAKIVDPWDAE